MGRGSGRSGIYGSQGTGKKLCVLDGLQPVGFGADPKDNVLLGNGSAVAVIGFALRISTAGRPDVEALAPGPGNRESYLPDGIRRLVVLWLGVHVAEHDRADLRDGHRLRGNLGYDLLAGFVELLIVHMGDDKHVVSEDQHGDVPAHFGPIEVRFKVDKVRHAVPPVQGVINDVGHEPGVKTGLLKRSLQALSLDAVVV
jgi:hypothetical protein